MKYEKTIADKLLYRGKVYRYLGNDHPLDNIVEPVFDGIYVSWSKKSENQNISKKLYRPITLISCEISAPFYGIDLDNLGCSRANEREVVFPTIENCVNEKRLFASRKHTDNFTRGRIHIWVLQFCRW